MKKIKNKEINIEHSKKVFKLIQYITSPEIWMNIEDIKKIEKNIDKIIEIYERNCND